VAYCKISDLLAWIEEADMVGMCSREEEAVVADDAVTDVLNAVIKTAGAKIDSYLIGRFGSELRTGTTPPLVEQACAQLAVYYLYLRRRAVDEDWQTNFEEIIAWLADLRDGKGELLLVESTGEVVDEPSDSIQHDAQVLVNSDLNTYDRRNYTPSKQRRLFGVGPHEH